MRASWGVLFDWDGVVIDSSVQHERAWELLAGEQGLHLPLDHFKAGFGKRNEVIIPSLGWGEDPVVVRRLANRKEEFYRELVRAEGVTVLPGARDLLAALRGAGVPRAVASSTPRENLDALFATTGLGEFFESVVCGSDVSHGKPDPEVFLKAAALLGLQPDRCVVIEDAFAGFEAARSAGMALIGVATTHSLDTLLTRGDCDLAVASLEEVTPSRMETLVVRSSS